MSNILKIKHGTTTPTVSDLEEFQMGYCEGDGSLYINDSGIVKKVGGGVSFNQIYPIGAIYTSVNNTNPSALFGGTWAAFGQGKMLVGFDGTDADFNLAEKTGGEKEHILTEAEMPSHTHTQDPHNHIQGPHNHTQDPHNHSIEHDHLEATTSSDGGEHGHSLSIDSDTHSHAWRYTNAYKHSSTDYNSVTTSYGSSGVGPSDTHTHSGSADNTNIDHTHTVDIPNYTGNSGDKTATNQETVATNQQATATNQSTGNGEAHNNLPPYITVYMWKRTA